MNLSGPRGAGQITRGDQSKEPFSELWVVEIINQQAEYWSVAVYVILGSAEQAQVMVSFLTEYGTLPCLPL